MKPNPKTNDIIIFEAERIMAVIADAAKRKQEIEAVIEKRILQMKSEYSEEMLRLAGIIENNGKDLKALMEANKLELFGADLTGGKRVDLPKGGALIGSILRRVKKVRGLLDRLKLAGMNRLIKVVETVDWTGVDELDDAILGQLGTKRVTVENFEYEIY